MLAGCKLQHTVIQAGKRILHGSINSTVLRSPPLRFYNEHIVEARSPRFCKPVWCPQPCHTGSTHSRSPSHTQTLFRSSLHANMHTHSLPSPPLSSSSVCFINLFLLYLFYLFIPRARSLPVSLFCLSLCLRFAQARTGPRRPASRPHPHFPPPTTAACGPGRPPRPGPVAASGMRCGA